MKLEDLAGLRFTYDEVGCTQYDETPEGFHRLEYRQRIGDGDEVFQRAADALLTWRMHRAAGIPVTATATPPQVGTDSLGRLGPGMLIRRLRTQTQLGLPVPCRVVRVVNEPDRIGFAYGTLAGHPEAGEESFLVTRDQDGVYATIRAYSRPATWYTHLAGPITRRAQRYAATRYAAALRRLAT
ncbi:uncharacterized protein (UPF0548 family) [Kribbella sp. VKM Ac-2571]|uniref:DUF1990 family protein n=1 Tax=Kribbella sp. VKM Ac-2571 TaxID=2512222 RepID=UPI00105F783F|nr:DUF1990 domain-containing protein [Kribbella sp. VKM Ac-2571]TDO66598.1 uncharacterized protein (UPF0548 family) [Kribbella sp. VKM Ac-2571]